MLHMMQPLKKLIRRFQQNEDGSMLMYVGFGLMVLVGATGSAIDMGRAQYVQARMSSALDAAGLAAGSVINTQSAQSVAERYFYGNFRDGFMEVEISNLVATPNADNTRINLSVEGRVDTTFMQVLGITEVNVSATSEVTRAMKGLELVLSMDNTGSMAGTKLTDMKTAATDLVNILYGDNAEVDDLWIGLVPFSQTVNIGTSRSAWVNSNGFNWGPTSWMGCVDARTNPLDTQDTPPTDTATRFTAYYWADHDSYNDWRRSDGTYRTPLTTARGPNKYCPSEVTPMTANKTTILNGINAMTAAGNTHTNLGAVWGWRMLSPNWRGYWGGDMNTNNLPLNYNTALMTKVLILLTDGENTHSNSVRTAYRYLNNGVLGTTNSTTAVTVLDARLTAVCDAMKAQGIVIYTIMFDLSNVGVENLFRNCASNPAYFFDSATPEELSVAFHTIGDSLANLHLSR